MQQELSNVDFRKEGGLAKYAFEYSNPFARKIYYPSDRFDSQLLGKVLEIKNDILKEGFTLEKESFRSPDFECDYYLERHYNAKRFKVYESFSDCNIDGHIFVGCTFDMQNLESKNMLHANFPVIHPNKKYSIDNFYIYLTNKGKNFRLPFNPEVAGNIINELLSITPQQIAAKVC